MDDQNLTPGGEPLWSASCPPRNFLRITSLARTCENRRLPRTTQRVVCLLAPEINHSRRPLGKTSRWVILGSRLFNPIVWSSSHWKECARSLGEGQSGSPPGVAPTLGLVPEGINQIVSFWKKSA